MSPAADSADPGRPFARGSVSLRLYPHDDLDAPGIVRELCDQAAIGLQGGFAGIMTSEHHGGFAGYVPNPMQMTSFILEENETGWAAACPMLLPLRPTAQVAEEVAWLDARHPGRVGLGVAAGARPLDFESMDVPVAEAVLRFKAEMPRVVDMLRGRDLRGLDGDPAFQRCATNPVPVLSAAISPAAGRRAARSGAGILTEGMSSPDALTALCRAYDEAGGTGTKMLIRRVWLGEPLTELVERQRAVYQSVSSGSRPFGDDQTISTTDPVEMAERLAKTVSDIGADAINLRVHLPGISPAAVRDQIARLCDEVVPALRQRLASVLPASPTPG